MDTGKQWISVSDLMSVLMMVFLFIAIIFMEQIQRDKEQVEAQNRTVQAIAKTYGDSREALYEKLSEEFATDFQKWDAEVLSDGGIRFRRPESLFARGSSEPSEKFKDILANFFPRYINVLSSSELRDEVSEIRIEGHTSSEWEGPTTAGEKYINNTELSQMRSFQVLRYVYLLPKVKQHHEWLRPLLSASGLSYSRPLLDDDGNISEEQSRRVEFHAKTSAEEKIRNILQQSGVTY